MIKCMLILLKKILFRIKWHKKWGYVENLAEIYYPNELYVNGMKQKEYYRTKANYNKFLVDNNILKIEGQK